MNLEQLSSALQHQNPKTRRAAASVIGLVEETRLLKELRAQYEQEPDENAQKMMMWAGKRVYSANQRGYNTIDEIFHYFGIDRELAGRQTEEEERILREMNEQLKNEMMKHEQGSNQAGTPTAGTLGVGKREGQAPTRTPAPRPTQTDVSVWLHKLQTDPAADIRKGCAMELANSNNITALPVMVANYFTEPEEEVKRAIEHYGKILYWGSVYWQMEQDGTLATLMDDRLNEMMAATSFVGNTAEVPVAKKTGPFARTSPLAQTSMLAGTGSLEGEEDLGDMLRRIEENKQKKSGGRRKRR